MNTTKRYSARLVLFGLLSLLDLLLTYKLLHGGTGIYEANPLAYDCLQRFGWTGLALYKLLAVSIFAAAAIVISVRRPRLGLRLMNFACLTVFAVVVYSVFLTNAAADRQPVFVSQDTKPVLVARSTGLPFAVAEDKDSDRELAE